MEVAVFFADVALARRLEAMSAEELRVFVAVSKQLYPQVPAEMTEVGGGVAAWLGPGSPVNQSMGVGMAGEVDEAAVEQIERFYAAHLQRAVLSVCPLANPTLLRSLAMRRWTITGFENVLVRELGSGDVAAANTHGIQVREAATEQDQEMWAQVMTFGFCAPESPTPAETRLGRVMSSRPGARRLLAFVDGHPAGTGELYVADGVGWLSADATLIAYRGRGVQRELVRARLQLASELGCELAVTESQPGSVSQRNQERNGFCVAYTRVDVRAPESVV